MLNVFSHFFSHFDKMDPYHNLQSAQAKHFRIVKILFEISFWHCYEDIFSGRPDPGLQLNLTRNHKKFTSTDFFAKVFVAALSGVSATYGRALQYCTRVSTTI